MTDELRARLNSKLKKSGFGDYRGLSKWLESEGFEISKTTLSKYGRQFKMNLDRIRMSTEQAKMLAAEYDDDGGALNEALIRQLQSKLFEFMQEFEFDPKNTDGIKLGRMIADLARASVSQNKLTKELRAEMSLRAQTAVENGDWKAEAAEEARRIMGFD